MASDANKWGSNLSSAAITGVAYMAGENLVQGVPFNNGQVMRGVGAGISEIAAILERQYIVPSLAGNNAASLAASDNFVLPLLTGVNYLLANKLGLVSDNRTSLQK